MTAISDVMRNIGLAKSNQEMLEVLNRDIASAPDHNRYSYQGLCNIASFGPAKASMLLGLMRASFDDPNMGELLRAEYAAITTPSADGKTGGLDFADPMRVAYIEQMRTGLLAAGHTAAAEMLTELLAIGQPSIKNFRRYGLAALPSAAELEAERPTAVAQETWGNVRNAVSVMLSGQTNWTAIKAYVASVE